MVPHVVAEQEGFKLALTQHGHNIIQVLKKIDTGSHIVMNFQGAMCYAVQIP